MFNIGERIQLIAYDAINKKGEITNYRVKFPIDKDSLQIPEDIIELSVIEYHEEECVNAGSTFTAFKIYVGKTINIRRIVDEKITNYRFLDALEKELHAAKYKDMHDIYCYYEDKDGVKNIFGWAKDNDIVVSNTEELKEVLLDISDNFKQIRDSIDAVRDHKVSKTKVRINATY